MARKILLADDSVTAQNMGRKILADAGYDVITVNNGSAALKRITEIKPDLIVLDVYMPGYSGLEVCQRLKDAAETAHIPVLLTVGKLEPFKPEEARRVRADAHIVKPFEASELLTAITRLEDRMVPQQSDGSRFATSVSGVERFSSESGGGRNEADADTGWKSRLRFPSKKKKEEPEPDEIVPDPTFQDSRKAKSKANSSTPFSVKPPAPPGQEPGLVPEIPRDITPEELDALSALAAKLDAPFAAAESPATVTSEVATVDSGSKSEVMKGMEDAAQVAKPAVATIEIPVQHVEPASETAVITAVIIEPVPSATIEPQPADPEPATSQAAESLPPATPSPVAAASAEAASVSLRPESVESQSSSVATPVKQAVDEPTEAVAPPVPSEATPATVAESSNPKDLVSKAEESASAGPKIHELKAEESAAAESISAESKPESQIDSKPETLQREELEPSKVEQAAPAASVATEPDEPAPTDEELAEALRLLTPAIGHADISSSIPTHGTLVAAGQLLAEEAARNAAAGPRWVAEAVALSPEEAALSLEAEMFRTLSPSSSTLADLTSAAASLDGIESHMVTSVSAITAAVETRLAEVDSAASARALAEQSEQISQAAVAETLPPPAIAEAAAVPIAATEEVVSEASATEAKQTEAKQDDRPVPAEEEPAAEVAAATFADAIGNSESGSEVEAHGRQVTEATEVTTAIITEEIQNSSSDSGGEESMGKSGKSNWHQIRTTPAGTTAGTNAVEAAKQAVEEAPKAMAAAAAAEGSASTSSTDAATIANIVDSVMADLRPRIVEEIAKKLSGK